jgi:hypothetical protein
MRRVCWAASLGDCDGPISDEHPISQAVFDTTELLVQGPGWPSDGRERPLKTLASTCLCCRHNNLLRSVDAEVGKFAKKLRALNLKRAKGTIHMNGWVLERWCLKALLGIVANGWHRNGGGTKIDLGVAPVELAAAAFGRNVLGQDRGLHVVTYTADVSIGVEAVSWKVLVASADASRLVGLLIALPPATFALTLVPGDPTPLLRQLSIAQIESWANVQAHLRPAKLDLRARESGTHIQVFFDWAAGADAD